MTKWTKEQYEELSRKVAEKFKVGMYQLVDKPATYCFGMQDSSCAFVTEQLWLHNDWHTIMELCVKHDITVFTSYRDSKGQVIIGRYKAWEASFAHVRDHSNDPYLTQRIARMLALLEIEL